MVKCTSCKKVGQDGGMWHLNQHGAVIWHGEVPKCKFCGAEVEAISAPGADACVAQLGYERVEDWLIA